MRQRQDFDAHVLEYAALKIPGFLFRPKNAHFANSPNTSYRLRMRCGEFKEGNSTTRF